MKFIDLTKSYKKKIIGCLWHFTGSSLAHHRHVTVTPLPSSNWKAIGTSLARHWHKIAK